MSPSGITTRPRGRRGSICAAGSRRTWTSSRSSCRLATSSQFWLRRAICTRSRHSYADATTRALLANLCLALLKICLYGEALRASLKGQLASVVETNFSADSLAKLRQACAERVKQAGSSKAIRARRLLTHESFGFECTVEVSDASMECEALIAHEIKLASLGKPDGLPLLMHEIYCFGLSEAFDPETPHKVPQSLLESHRAARQMAQTLLDRAEPKSLDDVEAVLSPVADALFAMDPSFRWEMKFISEVAPSALEAFVERQLLDRMPTEDKSVALQEFLLEVIQFQKDDPFVFSQTSTDKVECAKEVVHGMMGGTPPNAAALAATGKFYEDFLQGLKYFVRVELPGKHDKPGATLTGAKAMAHLFSETAKNFEAEPYPAFDDLQVFSTFKWMLDEGQKKQLTAWIKKIFSSEHAIGETTEAEAKNKKMSNDKAAGNKRVTGKSNESVKANKARLMKYF